MVRTLVDGDFRCKQRLERSLVTVLDGGVKRLAALQQLLLLQQGSGASVTCQTATASLPVKCQKAWGCPSELP